MKKSSFLILPLLFILYFLICTVAFADTFTFSMMTPNWEWNVTGYFVTNGTGGAYTIDQENYINEYNAKAPGVGISYVSFHVATSGLDWEFEDSDPTGFVSVLDSTGGVAEVAVESNSIHEGDEFYIMGPTTGVLEGIMPKMVFDEKESSTAKKGDLFTFKCEQRVRESDKLYVCLIALLSRYFSQSLFTSLVLNSFI